MMLSKKLLKEKSLPQDTILFDHLKAIIDGHQSFIITTHVLPDGDGLGGEIALASYLRNNGKVCHIINFDSVPEKFKILDPDFEIEVWDKNKILPKAQVIFAVDMNDWRRVGPLFQEFDKLNAKVVFIDHHLSSQEIKKNHIIQEDISSMGEFLYRFFRYVGSEITFKMALALYVSIYTDTNVFRHRKTTALSHAICAALVDMGVNPETVYQRVHQTKSLSEMHLLGEILNHIQTTHDGKIAWVEVTQELQKKYKAKSEDTEGFVDYLLTLKDIEIALLFREENNGQVKVSARSKGNVKIHPTIERLGGGGHTFEAGLLQEGAMQEVVYKTLLEIKKLV